MPANNKRALALILSIISLTSSIVTASGGFDSNTNISTPTLPFLVADPAALLAQDMLEFETDEVICDEVASAIVKFAKEGRRLGAAVDHEHETTFSCVVDPAQTRSGFAKGIHLDLRNVGPDFEKERQEAIANGRTRLIVRGGIVDGSALLVPDQADPTVDGETTFKPVLEWRVPPADSVSSRRHSRNLAVNPTGIKSVLIFRITALDGTNVRAPPTHTAVEVSDAVFGTGGDFVNLRDQYTACSYGQLDFAPAAGAELTPHLAADGVIDITVTVDARWYTNDITLAVSEMAQDSIANGGLGLDLEVYDHVMYHVPPGSIHSNSFNWVAFGYKVSYITQVGRE